MKIGYACICDVQDAMKYKTCRQCNATKEHLAFLIEHNLKAMDQILDFNYQQGILMYRLSSEMVPFGSSPVNTLDWQRVFASTWKKLGEKIKRYGMRVSFHPGQYTILNSVREDVIERAILDLQYHATMLDLMELDSTHKLILHVGGIYGDKKEAMKRFETTYQTLPDTIKQRLVLENDDRYYSVEDVLVLSKHLSIPVVFDNLHHAILPPEHSEKSAIEWLNECGKTWTQRDGRQKMHYSEQDLEKRVGAHAYSVNVDEFLSFFHQLQRKDIDVMLEVKDKYMSTLACIEKMREQLPTLLDEKVQNHSISKQ